jgi:hypothetical protein
MLTHREQAIFEVLNAPINYALLIMVRRKALRTLREMKLFMFGRVCSGVERTNE